MNNNSIHYQGRIVFHLDENAEHGLIDAKKVLGVYDWVNDKQKCVELKLNGYEDWYLPSKNELNQLYPNTFLDRGNFSNYCWSSTDSEFGSDYVWIQDLSFGYKSSSPMNQMNNMLAVRAF